jgi:ABC-2 type transport system ATP-binding protein
MKALDVRSVTFGYDKANRVALRDFSLTVEEGQMHALVGPNGAGKSTLMRVITGQLREYSGVVSIFERKMPDREALLTIGYAPQPIALYRTLTAWENLRLFGSLTHLSATRITDRSKTVLEQLGLSEHAYDMVDTYSGGMQRRLNLAVALLHEPKLLLLDEPTVGVDPQSRHHIYDMLASLNASGMTVVLCTHLMEEAQRLCKRVTLLDKGEMIFDGLMSTIGNLESFFLEKTGRGLRDD